MYKKVNFSMAAQWLIFFPIILPLCVIFGAVRGAYGMIEKMTQRMWLDLHVEEDTWQRTA